MVQPVSGPVCLFGTEFEKKVCWEILVAGSEQGMEAGQVGLRLVTKGERMTTVAKEWNIGASSIADGRYELFTSFIFCVETKENQKQLACSTFPCHCSDRKHLLSVTDLPCCFSVGFHLFFY